MLRKEQQRTDLMTKTLTNSAFVLASLIVVLVFVTSKTYPQLIFAVALYPFLVFLAFMIFPRSGRQSPRITAPVQSKLSSVRVENSKPKTEPTYVSDIDKRTFIKLIGATGISFFLFSMFGRGIENLLFGRNGQYPINPAGSGDQFGRASDPLTDGYKISEIDEGDISYYGFTNKDGAWLIMKEVEDGNTFRYAKGDSDFPGNWANREKLTYDYYYNVL